MLPLLCLERGKVSGPWWKARLCTWEIAQMRLTKPDLGKGQATKADDLGNEHM
jgi:hypothetical protein